jgi:hypothetical protein
MMKNIPRATPEVHDALQSVWTTAADSKAGATQLSVNA